MSERRIWIERKFQLGMPPDALPDLIERLRGTPARLAELVASTPPAKLADAHGGWSVLRNVGHLLDLEALWSGRLDDFGGELTELRPADMSNKVTEAADHDSRPCAEILKEFRAARADLVHRYENFSELMIGRTSFHPRLKQPMTVTDLAHFVAEHDDHHLARITELIRG